MQKIIILYSLLFLFITCKTTDNSMNQSVNMKINLEKKTGNSYEITTEPEIIFFNNAKDIFYYQILYTYPDEILYFRLLPEKSKNTFNPEKFLIKYENNIIELQIMEIKVSKNQKNDKIIICDTSTFDILKDDSFKIEFEITGTLNEKEKTLSAYLESYDRVYLIQLSDYIDAFKEKLKKEEEKKRKN